MLKARKIYIREWHVSIRNMANNYLTDESWLRLSQILLHGDRSEAVSRRRYPTAAEIDNGQIRGVVINS